MSQRKAGSGQGLGDAREWARCYYDAWNRRDWEWIEAMLAPEVEWYHVARDERVTGTAAVISSFRGVLEEFPEALIDVRAAHSTQTVVGEGTGVLVVEGGFRQQDSKELLRTATFCEIFELKTGRCVRGSTYADSVRLAIDMSRRAKAA